MIIYYPLLAQQQQYFNSIILDSKTMNVEAWERYTTGFRARMLVCEERKRLAWIAGHYVEWTPRGYEERGFRRAAGDTVIEFIGQTN